MDDRHGRDEARAGLRHAHDRLLEATVGAACGRTYEGKSSAANSSTRLTGITSYEAARRRGDVELMARLAAKMGVFELRARQRRGSIAAPADCGGAVRRHARRIAGFMRRDGLATNFGQISTNFERNLMEVGGKLIEVDGKLIEVDGKLMEADGKLMEVGGKLMEVGGKLMEVDGKLMEVDGKLMEVDGKLMEVDGKLMEVDGNLMGS